MRYMYIHIYSGWSECNYTDSDQSESEDNTFEGRKWKVVTKELQRPIQPNVWTTSG